MTANAPSDWSLCVGYGGTDPSLVAALRSCRCVWNGARCTKPSTQEDGLCDWCGARRPEDLIGNPNAMTDPITGDFLGLGGAGYPHVDPTVTPDACWMPNSGRTLADA